MRRDVGKRIALWALMGSAVWLFVETIEAASFARADLVVANGPDPRSLDPAHATAIADARIHAALFEGLVVPDAKTLAPAPGLAERWSISDDGLTYTFQLRTGLRFSDGHPLDAHDVVWSLKRLLDPRTAGSSYKELLWCVHGARELSAAAPADIPKRALALGIAAPDRTTVVLRLLKRTPYFLDILTLFPCAPVPRHQIERHGSRWIKPGVHAGTGAFRLASWRLRDRVRVERNPFYWDAENVSLETVDFLCAESPTTMLNLFVTGEADLITEFPSGAIDAITERFGQRGTGEYVPGVRLGTFFYVVNTEHPALGNAKVRRALSLAIDRLAIVKNVTRAGEASALSFVPPGTRGARPPGIDLRHDPERARALLAEGLSESGQKETPVLEILHTTESLDQSLAEVLQQQWQDVLRITCRLENQDPRSVRAATDRGEFAIARRSWIGDYNDPSTFLDVFNGRNPARWNNARYTELLALSLEQGDAAARAQLLSEAETLLLEEAPIIPIYHYVSRTLVSQRVTGFHPNVLDWHPPKSLGVKRP